MHIEDIFKLRRTTFSFEFFPPKSEKGSEKLFAAVRDLESLRPAWVSVTYGAGGSTRDLTRRLVRRIMRETKLEVMPHLTCVAHTEAEIYDLVEQYATERVSNILALGGDPPATMPGYDRSRDAFRYASDLVRFLREFRTRHGGRALDDPRGFGLGVAGFPEGHPSTPNRLDELDYLKQKVDAGANFIVTQLFFDNSDFYDFRERCALAGITVPIIAGVMPITSEQNLKRMAELALGARFPARLLRAIGRADGDPDAVRRVGLHWATEQCRDLLDHEVRGIHFYTLNSSSATREIYANLGVKDSLALA